MFKFLLCIFIIPITKPLCADQDLKNFEIQWLNSPRPIHKDDLETFDVTSSIGEKYTCFISTKDPKMISEYISYTGPLASEFIELLFTKGICSYRIDPYWTYELCHGRYIQQYHEIMDGSKLKLQEYTLGSMGVKEREMVMQKKKEQERKSMQNSSFQIPTKKIEKKELPYVEITMTDGSICDYNKRKRRKSNVFYLCDMKANHDIHQVKEIQSCVYEIIVLTPLLCAHPRYRPTKIPTTPIQCFANGKSPKIPYNLAKLYMERKKIIENSNKVVKEIEFLPNTFQDLQSIDPISVSDFLAGRNCMSGGTGEWKYEFCYGKYINQYTYGLFGLKTTVCLGKFNLDKHLKWIRKRPYKRPKPLGHRKHITQLYTDGYVSNVTGRPRQTEVKLKCMQNSANQNALVMYLYEPNHGEYLLGIESPILCHIVSLADDNGLVHLKT